MKAHLENKLHAPLKIIYLYLFISVLILSSGIYFYIDQKIYFTSPLKFRSDLIIFGGIVSLLMFGFYAFWRGREVGFLKSQISNVDQIHRLNRLYKVLSNSNQAIVRANSKQELMNEVCTIASRDGGYILCYITLLHQKTGLCIPVASDGEASEILENIVISARPDVPEGNGATGEAIRDKKFVIINDCWTDKRLDAWRDKVVRYNLRSLSAFPLHVDSKIVGTINFYSTETEYFNEDEIHLLHELSNDLSYALEKFEDELKRKEAEEALSRHEQEMRATLYSIGDGVISVDQKGSLVLMNNAAEQLTGWTEQEAKGRCVQEVFDIVNESSRERVDNPVYRVLQEGINFELANHTILKDRSGNERSIADCCAPICDNQGKVSGAVLIFRDQTMEVMHKRQLRESENQFRSLFESMVEGVALHELIYDSNNTPVDYRILDVNSAFMIHTGIDTDNIRGSLASIYYGASEAPYLKEYVRVTETLIPYSFEAFFPPLNKYFSIVCFSYQKGKFATVFEDITQQKQSAEILHQSEERYRSIINASPDDITIADLEGRILMVSPAAVTMFRLEREEQAFGLSILEFIIPEDRERALANLALLRQGDAPSSKQYRGLRMDGSTFDIDVNSDFIRDINGQPNKIVIIVRDISESKQAEVTLRKSEERYKMLVHNVPVGVFLVNADGKFTEVNDLMESLTGTSERQLLGLRWTSLVCDDDHGYVQRIWEKSLEKKEQFTIEFRLPAVEGQFKWISGNVVPILDDSGTVKHFLGAVLDISDRKHAEKERMLLKAELFEAQKLESIGTLAGGIAHDFNNILNIIMGYAYRLQNSDRSSEKHKSAIDTIIKAGDRGANLVQQILTFARKKKNVFANLELHSLLKEIIKMLRETFPHSINIETNLAPGIPTIYADMTQIHQAILNICVNARDAMPAGGTLTVSTDMVSGDSIREDFSRATEDSYVHIVIKDTGIGIEEEIRAKIFDPFFTTKPNGMGTGLGLSVVYGIVENHHGVIDIDTAPNIGTSFHLYLPEIKNSVELNNEFSFNMKDLPRGSEGVLIIEDEAMTLDLLSDTLQSMGYTVFTAPNGSEGIMMFEKEISKIDLVLCDLDLPVMNGVEVVRRIMLRNSSIKILMMSGFFSQTMYTSLEQLGVKGFFEKPVALQHLLMSLRKTIDSGS